MRRTFLPLLLTAALVFPLAAHAATVYDFTLVGEGNTVTYQFFGDVVPGIYYSRGSEFDSRPINDIVNGVPGLGGLSFFEQPSPPHADLFADWSRTPSNPNGGGAQFYGPILLSGLPQGFGPSPTFILGTFDLTAVDGAAYTLTVGQESPSSPVSEPGTLLLLATGTLGLFYLGARRRHEESETPLRAVSAH
jgi:hypothetical protein